MSVMVIYKEVSQEARAVEEFLHDFKQRTSKDLETIDPDSIRGGTISDVYDVVEYPTIIATSSDGQIRNVWRGLPMPTIDEVSYYV